MGRGYRTAKPQFIDFMFKPNLDMHLALANKEVESDALKKAFASSAEYDILPTFKAWQKDLDAEVSTLNESIDPVVQELIKDPNSAKGKRQLKQITDNAKELYSSGKIGQMNRHFREYQAYRDELVKDIDKTKDDRVKGFKRQRLESYDNYIKGTLGQGFNEKWSRRNLNPYIDAQKDLRDNIDVDKMLVTKDLIGKPVKVIKQGNSLIPLSQAEGSIKGDKFIDNNGKEHNILETRDDKLKALGLPFQYYRDDISTEGYLQDMINVIAQQRLQNPAYVNMLKDDFEMFGQGNEGETFQDFAKRKVLQEANMFAAQHPKLTKLKETRKDYKDSTGEKAYLEGLKHKNRMGLEAFKQKGKKDLAKLKGEIVTPEESLVLAVPEALVLPEEQTKMYDDWFNQTNAKNEGGKYDPAKLGKLNEVFEPVIEKDGKNIIKAYGDNPDNYKTPEAIKNRVMNILKDINKLQDFEWGKTKTTEWTGNSAHTRYEDTELRINTENAKKKLDKEFGNFNEYLSKNLNVMTSYQTLGTDDESNRIWSIIDQHTKFASPTTRLGGQTLADFDGNRRSTQRVDVDDSMWSTGRGKTLQRIMKVTGANSLKDLKDKGYLVAGVRPSGNNEYTVMWTPTEKLTELAEIETSDGTDIGSFKTTHSNIGNKIFKPSSDPEKNALYLQQELGPNYTNVKQKLNYLSSIRQKDSQRYEELYPNGYPLKMAGYNNLTFSVKDYNGGFKINVKNIKTGETTESLITPEIAKQANISPKSALEIYLSKGIYQDNDIKAIK